MTILIIIIAYIANVFLNRWLNKVLYKIQVRKYKAPSIDKASWFLSIISTLALLIEILRELGHFDWFTGKNWDKE